MSRAPKSQWDFGELFPPEETRRVLTVSDLTGQVRRLLEKQFGQLWVSGEVTNFRAQASGHIYFTLKDAGAQLSCVLFRSEAVAHRELLADGQKVLLNGEITVYEARGQYQLLVRAVELQGVGALQLAFECLKQKLAAAGLFATERKRALPGYPARIGLVTSSTGAAIRDVLHVIARRYAGLEIVLAPCRVQGDGAAAEISGAIRLLNEAAVRNPAHGVDLILVTRGGGSLEDLWAFNEEVLARAVFESTIPIVSAVGHEIDFTICDFVADFRAATPSAAAELITEHFFASRDFVGAAPGMLRQQLLRRMTRALEYFEDATARLQRAHPRRRLNEWLQRLDDLQNGMRRNVKSGVRERAGAARNASGRLARLRPAHVVAQRRELFQAQVRLLQDLAKANLREKQNTLANLIARLRLLGPEQVLARGYSITTDAVTGKVLRDAATVKAGQRLRTRVKIGEVRSIAEK
jgi:exodeoxyribonuclease VII large subunit